MVDVVEVLARAHALFAAPVAVPPATATGAGNATEVLQRPAAIAGIPPAYTERATADRASLAATAGVDDRMLQIVRSAAADHATAERSTRVILDAARADAQTGPSASPAEQQERMARQLARLRAQRAAVATARTRAQRRRALLTLLRYRKQLRLGGGGGKGRADEQGLQKLTRKMNRAVSAAFPQITDIGGVRPDSLKWHPEGLALDIMIPDWDSPGGRRLGNQVVNFLLANRYEFGLEHMMWRQHQINADGTSIAMADRGSANENHMNHVHAVTRGGGY